MSQEPPASGNPTDVEEPELVPEGAIRGIEDIHEGRTASTEELIEASLNEPD